MEFIELEEAFVLFSIYIFEKPFSGDFFCEDTCLSGDWFKFYK